eukprot:13846904-Alexandrium_andersonii.AAC.1
MLLVQDVRQSVHRKGSGRAGGTPAPRHRRHPCACTGRGLGEQAAPRHPGAGSTLARAQEQ